MDRFRLAEFPAMHPLKMHPLKKKNGVPTI